jgi:hypothetical protein
MKQRTFGKIILALSLSLPSYSVLAYNAQLTVPPDVVPPTSGGPVTDRLVELSDALDDFKGLTSTGMILNGVSVNIAIDYPYFVYTDSDGSHTASFQANTLTGHFNFMADTEIVPMTINVRSTGVIYRVNSCEDTSNSRPCESVYYPYTFVP